MDGNTQNDRDKGQIEQIRRDVERAENEGDADAFAQHLGDDVAMLPSSGPRRDGIDEVVAFHRDHFDTYDIDVEFSITEITVLGDLAVERGTYSATLVPTDGSESRDGGGDYLYVFERQSEGTWKIIRMSW